MASTDNKAFEDDPTGLGVERYCFDTEVPATTEPVPGRTFTRSFTLRPGFRVEEIQVDNDVYPIEIPWLPTDATGAIFRSVLQSTLEGIFPGETVSITGGGAGALCADSPTMFTMTIGCMQQSTAPRFMVLRWNNGNDLVFNAGMALDNYPPPTASGQQSSFAARADAAGNTAPADVLCTDTANVGWQTNDTQQQFEVWPRWENNGDPTSGDGGNFAFYNVTPTPRATNAFEINAHTTNSVVWQYLTVGEGAAYKINITAGGVADTDVIGVKVITGHVAPTPATPGDILDTTIDALNVLGLTGAGVPPPNVTPRYPWTEYNDTFTLTPGDYTIALVGPNNGVSSGGLIADMRVFQDKPASDLVVRDDSCTFNRPVAATIDRECRYYQTILDDDGVVTGYREAETGTVLTTAAFFAQDPPPGCCNLIPEPPPYEPMQRPIRGVNVGLSETVCGTVAGVATPLIRSVILSPSGVIQEERFIGADGANVQPSTWVPGDCGGADSTVGWESICYQTTANGPVLPGTKRHDDSFPAPGFLVFDAQGNPVNTGAPGYSQVVCSPADEPRTYPATLQDVTGGASLTVTPGTDLVSVTVRNRNATTATIQVGGGAVLPLDAGETWSMDVTDDSGGTLPSPVVINSGDGAVRVTVMRRA